MLRGIHGNNPHGYRERTGHAPQGSVEAPRRRPGQKVEMYLLPNGRLEVRAADRPAIEAGPAMLAAGGDFADGVIAFESRRLDGVVFT